MKSKITLSGFSTAITAIIIVALFIACIATVHHKPAFFILLAVYVVLFVCALLYGVCYIKADPDTVILGSILKKRKLRMDAIASVERFEPTMGAIRILGSGGFMGYWGIFREGDIGRYYAFYGKSSQCFLLRMKNGDKYVVGCENPDAAVDYIKSHIK